MVARERDSARQRTLMINFLRKMEMLEEVFGGEKKAERDSWRRMQEGTAAPHRS